MLLDLKMPKVTGWDVLAERATAPALQRIPVIVISAYSDPETRERLENDLAARQDRAEFELRKKVENGDAKFELRIKKRADVDDHYGHHDVEKRVEIRIDVRHY